jgi:phage tail-like protein
MADADERVNEWGRVYSAFRFSVEINAAGRPVLCSGEFSECDGLELNQEVKTIREGGNNGVQVRLAGPTTYGTLTLKRGMTAESFQLWDWFVKSRQDPAMRGTAHVVMQAPNRSVWATYELLGCLPLKLKAPPLNAKDGMVAVEELQIAYQSLTFHG